MINHIFSTNKLKIKEKKNSALAFKVLQQRCYIHLLPPDVISPKNYVKPCLKHRRIALAFSNYATIHVCLVTIHTDLKS